MKLDFIHRVYFVGIGGIGMSSIARFFLGRGCRIAGYDKTQTALTTELSAEGMEISYTDELNAIPEDFRTKDDELLIVFTPSVPASTVIRSYFKEKGFELFKRSQVLGMISEDHMVLAVAGTHGKTTTSTLLAHLLKHAGIDVCAFLGGISVNYETNFLAGKSEFVVVEADEYDRSFLTLYPHAAAITAMDPDHLDIYGDLAQMEESYNLFASQVSEKGFLLARKGLPIRRPYSSYSVRESADVFASNVRIMNGAYYFDYQDERERIADIRLETPGMHNVENATAAIRLAMEVPLTKQQIKDGVESFRGVKRRFEYILKTDKQIFIDDYAHHPEELRALIETVKALYPEKKMTLIFQPHLFSRTRDFYKELAEVLSVPDELILMEIYPARELPIEGVSSSMILKRAAISEKQLKTAKEILDYIEKTQPELLVCAGAGDIDMLLQPIKERLESGKKNEEK